MHLRQVLVDAPRDVHQHRARHGAVGRADEALGRELTVKVRHEGQQVRLADLGPWRLALEYDVSEGDVLRAGRGGLGGRVVPFNGPLGQLALEEVDKVLLHLGVALAARDARDQDGGQEGARVDVEVGTRPRDGAHETVRERLVGGGLEEEQEEEQHRGGLARPGEGIHGSGC